jgi:hypothetical protein
VTNESTPWKSRPWRDIARELACETNSAKILALSEELNQALNEQAHSFPADDLTEPKAG